jgi:hypothetical protein
MTRKPGDKATPLRLDEGLYLENSRVLLPWRMPWSELKKIGRPEVYDRPKARGYSEIVWRKRTCLGGLRCTVEAEIFYVSRGWSNWDKTLRDLDIIIHQPKHARDQFRRAEQHLRRVLGKPTVKKTITDGYNTFPRAAWCFPNVQITLSISERFVEQFSFVISWTGKKVPSRPRPSSS